MKTMNSPGRNLLGAGVVAGLTGTGVMMAMRSFDQRYAPQTIPKAAIDPGVFVADKMVRAARLPRTLRHALRPAAALAAHTTYGTVCGLLYSLIRGPKRDRSAVGEGIAFGAAVYTAGYLGWLPALGLQRPIWKQRFPEVLGEIFRHLAYGVATIAAGQLLAKTAKEPELTR